MRSQFSACLFFRSDNGSEETSLPLLAPAPPKEDKNAPKEYPSIMPNLANFAIPFQAQQMGTPINNNNRTNGVPSLPFPLLIVQPKAQVNNGDANAAKVPNFATLQQIQPQNCNNTTGKSSLNNIYIGGAVRLVTLLATGLTRYCYTVFLRGLNADYTGIGAQFRCVPNLSNVQELFRSLINKSIINDIVWYSTEKKNTVIAVPKLDYVK